MESTFANNSAFEDESGDGKYAAISKRSSGSESEWEPKRAGRRRTIAASFLAFLLGAIIGVGIMAILFTQSFKVRNDLCSPFTLEQYATTPNINSFEKTTSSVKAEETPMKRVTTATIALTTLYEITHTPPPSSLNELETTEIPTTREEMSTAYDSSSTNGSMATTGISPSTAAATTKLSRTTVLTSTSKTETHKTTTTVTEASTPTTSEATTKHTTNQSTKRTTTSEDTTLEATTDLTTLIETTELETTTLPTTTTTAKTTIKTTVPTTTPEVTDLPIATTESEVTTGNPIPNGCDIDYERKCFRAVVSNELDVHWNESKMLCDMEGWKLANIYSLSHFYMVVGYLRQNFPKSGYISAWTGMRMIPQDLQIVLSTGKNITLWNIQWNKGYPSKHPADIRMGIDLIMLPSRESILSQGLWNYDPSWNGNAALCEEEY